jgi:hypothetical protein
MRSTFLTIIAFLSLSTAQAQITVNQLDLPSVGESWTLYGDDGTSSFQWLNPPGGNLTWNFSTGWNISDTTTYQWLNIAALPNPPSFPNSNIGLVVSNAGLTTNAYCSRGASGLYVNGFTANVLSLINLTVTCSNFPLIPLPLTYGSTFTISPTYTSISIPVLPFGDAEKTVSYETITYNCDAWGTLTTPSQTAAVLRLKSHITSSIDSTFLDPSGTGTSWTFDATFNNGPDSEYDYTFFKDGPGTMMMTCRQDIASGQITLEEYLGSTTVSVSELTNNVKTVAYPNPVNDMLTVHLIGTGINSFKMFDATGREVFSYDVNGVDRLSFNTSQFQNGLYVYFLYNGNGQVVGSSKVVVQH